MIDISNRPIAKTSMFELHRNRTLEGMRSRGIEGCILAYGLPEQHRPHSDYEPYFRQDSCFYWLTGINAPDCALYIDIATGLTILFFPKIDDVMVIWAGPQPSLEDAKAQYGFTEAMFTEELPQFLAKAKPTKIHSFPDTCLLKDSGFPVDLKELIDVVGELRQIKDKDEIELIQYACDVNSDSFKKAMKAVKPGMYQFNMESILVKNFIDHYCRIESFQTICCSGELCSILHYHDNDKQIKDGEFILLDAGCEYSLYAADNTRTFPANGKFNEDQRLIYQAVLDASNAVFKAAKPGAYWPEIGLLSAKVMAESLIKAGLFVNGTVDEIINSGTMAVFYPHGLGHGMGLDVHEILGWPRGLQRPAMYHAKAVRMGRTLQPGYVVTVEPGCYFIKPLYEAAFKNPEQAKYINREACERFRKSVGGVRIEDDILITEEGCKNLSHIPREIADIEAFMAQKE